MFIDPLLLAFFVLNPCLALFGLGLTDRYLQLSTNLPVCCGVGSAADCFFQAIKTPLFLSAFLKVRTGLH